VQRYLDQMLCLADKSDNPILRPKLKVNALGGAINIARRRNDEASVAARLDEMMALMNAATSQDDRDAQILQLAMCSVAISGFMAIAEPLSAFFSRLWAAPLERKRTYVLLVVDLG